VQTRVFLSEPFYLLFVFFGSESAGGVDEGATGFEHAEGAAEEAALEFCMFGDVSL
jgi:hypothetical protein